MQDWQQHCKIHSAARALAQGQVIAYPTEAVWGLGCDPFIPHALYQILALKQRPLAKGVILVAANMAQLQPYLRGLSQQQLETMAATWPGPTTWVIPDNGYCPSWVRGAHASLAVRVSAHPVVNALCSRFGGPIVSTSANPAAMPPARTPWHARRYFRNANITYAPGNVGNLQQPTQIKNLITGATLRSA